MQDILILDVRPDFEVFQQRVKPHAEDLAQFSEDTVKSVLEYIHSAANAEDMLKEFVRHLEEAAAGEEMEESAIEVIKDAAYAFGEVIFKHLRDIGAYDFNNTLPFKLKEVRGWDIILAPLEPEDLGVPSADLDGEEDKSDEDDLAVLYDSLHPDFNGNNDDNGD